MTRDKLSFPFKAVIFDLDGTLLDSMGVWLEVDRLFFEELNIPMPEDYSKNLAGLSYPQCAMYTRERFSLDWSIDRIINRWTELSIMEYRDKVSLKPGAREFLALLKDHGIKLGVATALLPELYEPCLRRNEIYEMFDAFCTVGDAGDAKKSSGVIFRRCAEKLGVAPEDCAVFEDVMDGIKGAKHAGMLAFCVEDPSAHHSRAEMSEIADGIISDFKSALLLSSDQIARAVIFTGRIEAGTEYVRKAGDLVIAADAGWYLANAMGIVPDIAMGDFDSSPVPEGVPLFRSPSHKDDTDTMLAIKFALALGIDNLLIIGGLGGAFGHTLANIQSMNYIAVRGGRVEIRDGGIRAFVVRDSSINIGRGPQGVLSMFSMSEICTVDGSGLEYPLDGTELSYDFPLGASNSFLGSKCLIKASGTLLIVVE